MIDYSKIPSTPAEPEASSMIETFRAIGYSVETAIADIVDNSIAAGAMNIWIDFAWEGPETILSIVDDGIGMEEEQLIQAMRPGSVSPLEERRKGDLGRFGLGLKTASFSQCRKFALVSKRKSAETSYWAWDLDFVNHVKAWRLIKHCPDVEEYKERIENLNNGTAVVWWEIDRLTKNTLKDDDKARAKFLANMAKVKKHLGMVFHRFIDEGLQIHFNGRQIKSWDPFMIGFDGLQTKPENNLEAGNVRVKGFVLPHRSKLSPEDYNYGKGPEDSWTAHQGFYVYRNKRLLVAGDWLGYFKKEVHYDLCRVRIDLDSTMDMEWQTDIKKSVVRPPGRLKDVITSVAKDIRAQAVEVYRHKGKVISRKLMKDEYHPFWEERLRHGKRFYKLNRNHPLILEILDELPETKAKLEKLLQFVEETVPVPLITLQESEDEKPSGQPFEGKDQEIVRDTMRKMYGSLISKGNTDEQAKRIIMNIEPFNFYPQYLEFLNQII